MTLSAPLPGRADGCFVFKWNKAIDINEPTQKAVIVHDAGREDLLLQVKYEGPLEEFGWLIPVPSLPKVEKGPMEPFYELSQLTQRQFARGGRGFATLGYGGREEAVKVVEIKTVGVYEAAVLSAQDAGSLARWLQTHDYSMPEGRSEVVDNYIRRGWYFIAARIQLDKGDAFKAVSNAPPKDVEGSAKARKTIERQLASGELHPLLISFDTPECVFPLKISAVGGKPSEVSLYVLATEPLLERFMFEEALGKLHQERQQQDAEQKQQNAEREKYRAQRQTSAGTSIPNYQTRYLAAQMYPLMPRGMNQRQLPDWTVDDLLAMAKEGEPKWDSAGLEDGIFGSSDELLRIFEVKSEQIPLSAKVMPQLKDRSWFLTKHVRTFRPEEMHDLEFEPAVPIVARTLGRPEGAFSASFLSQCGRSAVPALIAACRSSNVTERVHASAVAGWPQDPRFVEPLLALLKDASPQIRYNALCGVRRNWDSRFIKPLISLLRDEHAQISSEANYCLRQHDSGDKPQLYLRLLKDSDPNVQMCALQILSRTNTAVIPRAELVRLLGASRMETVWMALDLLGASSSAFALPPFPGPFTKPVEGKQPLSSEEAAPLTTNQITLARLIGLKILSLNADADAIELLLLLLSDTNSIVRNRAFHALRAVSGQEISPDDPAKWKAWWVANKVSFRQRTAAP